MKSIIERIFSKVTEVQYEYTGNEIVPRSVKRVRFHPSVVFVNKGTFEYRDQLIEVILNDGVREIGQSAFLDSVNHCEILQFLLRLQRLVSWHLFIVPT